MRQQNRPGDPGETVDGRPRLVFHEGHELTLILEPDGRLRHVLQSSGVDGIESFSFGGQTIGAFAGQGPGGSAMAAEWEARMVTLHTEKKAVRYVTSIPGSAPGRPETVECVATPILAADGVVESILLQGRDKAIDLQVAEESRELQEQLRAALEVTGLGRYALYFDEERLTGDARLSELLGVADVESMVDREGLDGVFRSLHADDVDRVRAAIASAAAGGPDYDVEYRVWRPTGDPASPEEIRWLAGRGRVEFEDGKAVRMVGVIEDITERRLEEDLRLRWQKREAIGTLAGGVAHDFNNVISAILSNAALAAKEVDLGLPPTTSILEISRGAERAAGIVQRLLAFSREENDEDEASEPFDLGEVVREACALAMSVFPSDAELSCTVADALPPVTGSSEELHRVVVNLLTNAGHAVEGLAGSVTVRVEHDDTEAAGRIVRLIVDDTGPGIPDAVVDRIFDPFFTTKPVGKGTGLGLAATQTIVRHHGGTIEAETPPDGRGARFVVELPAARARPSSAESTADVAGPTAAEPGSGSNGVRVLFVDDEQPLVLLAERALPIHGHTVSAFNDPVAALAALTADPSSVDALVTDLAMPAMSGLNLIAEVRALRPDLPVVLSSGFLTTGNVKEAERQGVDAIVPKPCSMDDIAKALGDVLRAGRRA